MGLAPSQDVCHELDTHTQTDRNTTHRDTHTMDAQKYDKHKHRHTPYSDVAYASGHRLVSKVVYMS